MRSLFGRESLFSVGALLITAVLVQTIYFTVIRPRAAAILALPATPQATESKPGVPTGTLESQAASETPRAASNASNVPGGSATQAAPATRNLRSVFVILKDYEQETALILAFWALALIAHQASAVAKNRRMLGKEYVEVGEGRVVLPDDARAYARPLEALPREEQDMLLPRALMVALNRFGATRSVQDCAEAVRAECENELDRLDAQLSMVRFTAWAIPAVGFVGTVRGIGRALQEAQGALQGDISGVTLGLGVTFNATLTALVACILVMFFLHQLQQAQDRLVLDARMYIDRRLIRHMRVL